MRRILLSVALASAVVINMAPLCAECERYDFERSLNTLGLGISVLDLISWTGGTAQQCERFRRQMADGLKGRLVAVREAEQKASARYSEASFGRYSQDAEVRERAANSDAYATWTKAKETTRNVQRAVDAFPRACTCMSESTPPPVGSAARPRETGTDSNRLPSTRREPPSRSRTRDNSARDPGIPDSRTDVKPAGSDQKRENAQERVRVAGIHVQESLARAARAPRDEQFRQQALAAQREFEQAQAALSAIVNPFGPNQPVSPSVQRAQIVAPFGPSTFATDVRGGSGTAAPSPTASQRSKEKLDQVKVLFPLVDTSIKTTLQLIQTRRGEMQRLILNPVLLRSYGVTLDNVEGSMKGVSRYFSVANYSMLAIEIAESDGNARRQHIGEFIVNGAKDLATTGLEKFGTRLLGAEAAAVLRGASSWAATAGTLLTSPMNDVDNREPYEIIRDTSSSVSEHQRAIGHMWRLYERQGATWSDTSVRELAFYSGLVYSEAIGAEKTVTISPR